VIYDVEFSLDAAAELLRIAQVNGTQVVGSAVLVLASSGPGPLQREVRRSGPPQRRLRSPSSSIFHSWPPHRVHDTIAPGPPGS
jgi:hypothetical protein